jgi:hypothetical protein
MQDDRNDRAKQKKMNEKARCMHHSKAQDPSHQQNNKQRYIHLASYAPTLLLIQEQE